MQVPKPRGMPASTIHAVTLLVPLRQFAFVRVWAYERSRRVPKKSLLFPQHKLLRSTHACGRSTQSTLPAFRRDEQKKEKPAAHQFCNEAARDASYWACEEPISSRDMFLATFRRSSGYARIIRCGRSARW